MRRKYFNINYDLNNEVAILVGFFKIANMLLGKAEINEERGIA